MNIYGKININCFFFSRYFWFFYYDYNQPPIVVAIYIIIYLHAWSQRYNNTHGRRLAVLRYSDNIGSCWSVNSIRARYTEERSSNEIECAVCIILSLTTVLLLLYTVWITLLTGFIFFKRNRRVECMFVYLRVVRIGMCVYSVLLLDAILHFNCICVSRLIHKCILT